MSVDLPINPSTRGPETFVATAGQTTFTGGYPVQEAADVVVETSLDGGQTWTAKTLGVDYTLTPAGTGFTIVFAAGRADGEKVRHYGRQVVKNTTDFSPANTLKRAGLNAKLDRLTMADQELARDVGRALKVAIGQAAGTLTVGAAGETLIFDGAGNVVPGADQSEIQNAQGYAAAAQQAATDAQQAWDQLRGSYYGGMSTDPVTDPLGQQPGAGDIYFNTAQFKLRVYTGTVWQDATQAAGALLTANNLADVPNPAAARANLGLRPSAIVRLTSTNKLAYPTFDKGGWAVGGLPPTDARYYLANDGAVDANFNGIGMLLGSGSTAQNVVHRNAVPIDPAKDYNVGLYAKSFSGTINIQIELSQFAAGENGVGTITVPFSAGASLAAYNSVVSTFDAATEMVMFGIRSTQLGTMALVHGAFCVPTDQWPAASSTGLAVTHEGAFDGTHLYTINHSHNCVSKFDANLVALGHVSVTTYPHDILILGSNLWIVSFHGKSIQRIDKASMSVTGTWAITGNRRGLGIATDGTNLFIGATTDDASAGALIKFDPVTTTQTVITTDVYGGFNNNPVQYLAGSLWSNKSEQIKRINPLTGATQATITPNKGFVYGLGHDGTFLYAQAQRAVMKIDPATNTVVKTLPYRTLYGMGSNLKADPDGNIWGAARNGFFVVTKAGELIELVSLGTPKFVQPAWNRRVIGGYNGMPSLDVLSLA